MRINSEDCYIEYRKKVYYLFVPKSKKEIKEEEGVLVKELLENEVEVDPKYKLVGYSTNPLEAIKKIIKIRKDKKYKLKQPYKDLIVDLQKISLLDKILYYSHTFEFDYQNLFLKLFVIPKFKLDTSKSKHKKIEEKLLNKSIFRVKKDLFIKNNLKQKYEDIIKIYENIDKE